MREWIYIESRVEHAIIEAYAEYFCTFKNILEGTERIEEGKKETGRLGGVVLSRSADKYSRVRYR